MISVSSGDYVAVADIPDGIVPRMSVGATGTLGSFTDTPVPVTIVEVDQGDPEHGVSGSITMVPTGGESLPVEWEGQEIVATIAVQTVATDALIVPSRAVSTDASGNSSVTVVLDGGSTLAMIPVRVVGELNGLTAIEAASGDVNAGDVVVVG